MFNRYVDGRASLTPTDQSVRNDGKTHGYSRPCPPNSITNSGPDDLIAIPNADQGTFNVDQFFEGDFVTIEELKGFRTMKLLTIVVFVFYLTTAFAQNGNNAMPSTTVSVQRLEKDIPELMKKAKVPGLAIALIRKNKLVWTHYYGVANASTKAPVTDNTIFEAASLTKVAAAYGFLKLVDKGLLDLDRPLNTYLGNNYDVGDDARLGAITARRVLSHTSGFPNWRNENAALLPINFTPGEKFSYSGEGFVYLAKVVEKITGLKFEEYMQEAVLDPLKMTHSSFVWKNEFKDLAVHRHDLSGNVSSRNESPGSNAAASLRTTATDYALFMKAILNGTGLKKKTWQQMLTQQINVDAKSPHVFWGLGVGLEINGSNKSFWHWGDQGDSKAWMMGDIKGKNAVVYFANSMNGLSFTKEILDDALGGEHPAVAWLDYERFDSPSRNLMTDIIEKGANAALREYNEMSDKGTPITEGQFNDMGYQLMALNKMDEAIVILKKNAIDYPASANAWDSLGDAYQKSGDKENAIISFGKAVALDPKNASSAAKLKKLLE